MGTSRARRRTLPHESHINDLGTSLADQTRHCSGRGNWAALENECDKPDDLGILTTYRDPTARHFDIFRDTSAATAIAGNFAGKILAAMPERWPETIRALMVHAAEWTPPMQQQFDVAATEQQKRSLLQDMGMACRAMNAPF